MFMDPDRAARALGIVAMFATTLLACAPDPTAPEIDEAPEVVVRALSGGSGLTITGSSTLTPVSPQDGHVHLFDGLFNLSNKTGKTVTISKQLFFFAAPGGYAFMSPSFDRWWTDLSASSAPVPAGPFGWGWSAPVAHLVVRVDGKTSSGTKLATLASVPLVTPGLPAPGASPYVDDIDIGVQGPIELLNLTSGERWLPITGTVVDTTSTATAPPSLSITARNGSGNTVATLSRMLGPAEAPIRTFIAWAAIPSGASVASVRITATQSIAGQTATQTRNIPVVGVTPLPISSPVAGIWTWANGPGQTEWHAHTGGPEARYAYDLCIDQLVDGNLQPFSGDPTVNENWFCWAKPIRAAQGGTVRMVVDSFEDNNGNLQDKLGPNNEIIIEHPNGMFTRYAHMRKGSALVGVGQVVAAGTVIAEVGNAGGSSGPHLHFHAYKIDATGRQQAVPVTVNGLKNTAGVGLVGIPKGPLQYETP
jgi:hypothetical protein